MVHVARTPDHISSSSESGNQSRIDQTESGDSSVAAPASSINEGTSSSSLAPATGRSVEAYEPAFDVSQTVASTISHRDTTGIGRSLPSRDAPSSSQATALELVAAMQMVLTRTLVAAAYVQSSSAKTVPSDRSRAACREYAPRARSILAPSSRVPVIC
ncbi:hypothetical protein NLG97_g10693 [Lecanicillium saksenae]|uniref:Uncharacterized protein n=1 Tax=Lecanicillium saksenae TaxID=468837 RepID=A0ACC1QE65_9HYPO|nr:hypothetical protein NLG97_g10693 [Lecanicillium saksenae]